MAESPIIAPTPPVPRDEAPPEHDEERDAEDEAGESAGAAADDKRQVVPLPTCRREENLSDLSAGPGHTFMELQTDAESHFFATQLTVRRLRPLAVLEARDVVWTLESVRRRAHILQHFTLRSVGRSLRMASENSVKLHTCTIQKHPTTKN